MKSTLKLIAFAFVWTAVLAPALTGCVARVRPEPVVVRVR
jgi:hypothetical protein